MQKSGKRILIVDDNDSNQFVAMEQIEQAGFEADVAANGEQAVERAKSARRRVGFGPRSTRGPCLFSHLDRVEV